MNKQDVYIPVSVEENPPQCFNTVNSGDSWKVAYFHKDAILSEQWSDDVAGRHLTFPTHWLKPLKQVYVLTEDELRHIYNQSHKEGQGFGQFIKSL